MPSMRMLARADGSHDMSATAESLEQELMDQIIDCYDDFLRFVMFAFQWGEAGGPLEEHDGPDVWQLGQMDDIKHHLETNPLGIYRDSTSSGHGIGKSTQVAWLILWLMSTRPHLNGIVTANTVKDQNMARARGLAQTINQPPLVQVD